MPDVVAELYRKTDVYQDNDLQWDLIVRGQVYFFRIAHRIARINNFIIFSELRVSEEVRTLT